MIPDDVANEISRARFRDYEDAEFLVRVCGHEPAFLGLEVSAVVHFDCDEQHRSPLIRANNAALGDELGQLALSLVLEVEPALAEHDVTLRDAKTGIKDQYEPGM